MIKEMMFMASYGSYGGLAGDFIYQMEQLGVFSFILPFLLIFALVFGIISKTKLFEENKAVNAIIALVVALMSLQFNVVSVFFSEIFPRTSIGLSIILVIIILLGIFMPKATWVVYVLFGASALILIIVLIQTSASVGWSAGYWWYDNWPTVAVAIVLIVLVIGIVGASSSSKSKFEDIASPFLKSMFK